MYTSVTAMKNHYIICGFGRMGQQIAKDLAKAGVDFLVIEQNPEQIPKLIANDISYVDGSPSDNKVLKAAGVNVAKGFITVAPTDEENVFITLSARALNPNIFIVARSILEENEGKLRMAGANRVMSPYVMGGKRMAAAVLRPNVLDFLEHAMYGTEEEVEIVEIEVPPKSCFIGLSLIQTNLRAKTGVTVIGIKHPDETIVANPSDNLVIGAGDILIALGTRKQQEKAEKQTCEVVQKLNQQ